jgi:hypothetical protein
MRERVLNEYGFLAIQRVNGGILKVPDEEVQSFEDFGEATRTWQQWLRDNRLPQAIEEVQRQRDAFIAGCTVTTKRVPQRGWTTPDIVFEEAWDPDGRAISAEGNNAESTIKAEARGKYRDPSVEELSRKLAPEYGVTKKVVWAAGLYTGGEYTRLKALTSWQYGLPIKELLVVLNDLAADGWAVAHVSEDRGVFQGTTTSTDSAVTKTRYLLVRERAET